MAPVDFVRDFEAAHPRHGDVQDGHVRLERLYGLKGLVSIGRVATDFPSW